MTDWDPKVLAALIAAFVSLLVALYQTMARRRDALDIEELKARLESEKETQGEYLRRYLEYMLEGKEHELTAFREMLKGVQALREKIRTLSHQSYSHDPTELSKELRQMAQELANCFAANQTFFSRIHCQQAHTLKSKCISLASQLSDYVIDHPRGGAVALPPNLTTLQDEIDALQRQFRESAFMAIKSFSDSLKVKVHTGGPNG